MMRRVAILALLVGGCGSTAAVERRVDELEQELRDLRRSHALVSQRVRDVDRLGQTTFLLQDSIEQISLEVDRLQSQDTERNARLKATEAALFGDVPAAAPGQAAVPAPRAVAVAPAPRAAARTPAAVAAQAANDDPRGVYQEAYAAMDGGQLEAAIAGFERVLALAPKHDLADNAHYWLGEIFQRLGDVRTASLHFRSIIEEYSGGNKVPDALYKLGTLAEDAGNRDEAAAWYRKVVEQYAWSPVAEKASARLGQAPANP